MMQVEVFTPPPPMMLPGQLAPVLAMLVLAIAATVILRPLVRAWARRLEHRGEPPAELQAELDELRARLTDVEVGQARIADVEERLDFAERLLAQQRAPERIDGGRIP